MVHFWWHFWKYDTQPTIQVTLLIVELFKYLACSWVFGASLNILVEKCRRKRDKYLISETWEPKNCYFGPFLMTFLKIWHWTHYTSQFVYCSNEIYKLVCSWVLKLWKSRKMCQTTLLSVLWWFDECGIISINKVVIFSYSLRTPFWAFSVFKISFWRQSNLWRSKWFWTKANQKSLQREMSKLYSGTKKNTNMLIICKFWSFYLFFIYISNIKNK